MCFFNYRTDEEYYKHINRTIIDGNLMNMSLIIMEVNYGAIDADDYSCHGYYIIKFSSSSYIIQSDLSIYGWKISFCEKLFGETIFSMNIKLSLVCFTKQLIQ